MRGICYYIILSFLLAAVSTRLAAQTPAQVMAQPLAQSPVPGYWQQQVDYSIDAALNDTESTLDGFIKIQYTNHSPDTLSFIWFHLWPNAYKNDRTAFSEQLLEDGRTDFYFSDKEQKGYINRLDFRVDGTLARMEDHPSYIDIIKVVLPHPLVPGGQILITTPFHEKLPANFSRGGHQGQSYQLTQWYPKPAVYDQNGWHPMPYLDQGEFYSEYGNFDVRITLPENYVVAATGELKEGAQPVSANPSGPLPSSLRQSPLAKLHAAPHTAKHPVRAKHPVTGAANRTKPASPSGASSTTSPSGASRTANPSGVSRTPPSSPNTKTLRYTQNNIHDFALFADKRFQVDHDTLRLASGRVIDLYAFYTPEAAPVWKNSILYIKKTILFRSSLVGEYPFDVVSAAEVKMGSPGGMEYPTVTSISPQTTAGNLEKIIEHEVGHNWFYAVLGTNERRYPWMDEGMNTYYDKRYEASGSGAAPQPAARNPRSSHSTPPPAKHQKQVHSADNAWLLRKMPEDPDRLYVDVLAKERLDQPISTSSEDFTTTNYDLVAYAKAAGWMQQLEHTLGTPLFDSCMRAYYRLWQFRHPSPEAFRAVVETTSQRSLDTLFAELDRKGPLTPFSPHRGIRPTFLFSGRNTDKISYINILPGLGTNYYDRLMVGVVLHNYELPPNKFQFLLAPLYATGSHQLNGIGGVSYTWRPDDRFQKITLGIGAYRFSDMSALDSNGKKIFGGFYKFTPSLRLTLKNKDPRSTLERWAEWKTYFIGEKAFTEYVQKSTDSVNYPLAAKKYAFRYLNQLSFSWEDKRILYPYKALLQIQQASGFYRVNLTGNYFFNYATGGGMDMRFFGAKFGYIGGQNTQSDISRYMPKLTGVAGNEDYTYSDYFYGRNEFTGFASQQIMNRDGGLKIRIPYFSFLEGRSDNWVASLNFTSTLPPNVLPSWLPLKIFLDLGTYSEAWQDNPPTSKFLYTAGLQLSLFHNVLNFYAPIFYSSDFSNSLKTLPDQNTFFKKVSFSIDIQNINFHTFFPGNTPF